jgi:hypothetical protein
VGTVRDGTGAIVPDAEVTLTNIATGVSAERLSDANGNVEFFTVRIGTYVVTAETHAGAAQAEATHARTATHLPHPSHLPHLPHLSYRLCILSSPFVVRTRTGSGAGTA